MSHFIIPFTPEQLAEQEKYRAEMKITHPQVAIIFERLYTKEEIAEMSVKFNENIAKMHAKRMAGDDK